MDLFKKPGENDRAFIFRIGRAKEQGIIDLTWEAIADIFNKELTEIKGVEEEFSASTYRQQYRLAVLYYEDVFKDMVSNENNLGHPLYIYAILTTFGVKNPVKLILTTLGISLNIP